MTEAALIVLTLVALAVGWMLARQRGASGRRATAGAGPTPAAVVALAGVPLLALGLYLSLGRGDPIQPVASTPMPPAWAEGGATRPSPAAGLRTDRSRDGAPSVGPTSDAALAATAAALAETTAARRSTAAAPAGAPDIEALLQRLAQRLKTQPDDADGWLMLARSTASLDRHDEAAKAYAQAARLRPQDPDVLADWADSLAMAQGRSARGEPTRLIERALALDPAHPKARVMAGTAALERGDRSDAARHFEAARAVAPADSGLAQALDRQLAALQPGATDARSR